MEVKYTLTISKPCHEDWNAMPPNSIGRFCENCEKSVVDFTNMNSTEIQNYFVSNQGKKICGRFSNQQLNLVIIQIPNQVLHSQTNFYKIFLLALLISMGTTLFSCTDKNGNKQKINKVEVADSLVIENTAVEVISPAGNDSLYKSDPANPKNSEVRIMKPTKKYKGLKKPETNIIYREIMGNISVEPIIDSLKTK
ncbi:conserved hypothetical protein [Flavobacterium psychrophilum]|uniref:hypothetical protein n=1 Tax=Flavobacterium psychrophilum TaxID=96345 RepID=UPI00073E4CC1|nr:hypothetical protein [Flavobacterium psychrophilum]SNB29540.1 conserved hypothetical protein [Flavobacterium psychrophilum]SNB96388.1 conserved hypothetical protein [Flavobacterium psychrophilum]GAQ50007.1 hypothetical protein FPK15_contig00084-0002 [Flavobacterium psychrophilum]GEJ30668.1 hypothetical protein FPN186_contig00114-0002 [Flavobacterium psychrophilum]GEJ33886.1 hypothetical protein FPN185_contig00088-0002 [Flavobacterium psychrophilum]